MKYFDPWDSNGHFDYYHLISRFDYYLSTNYSDYSQLCNYDFGIIIKSLYGMIIKIKVCIC